MSRLLKLHDRLDELLYKVQDIRADIFEERARLADKVTAKKLAHGSYVLTMGKKSVAVKKNRHYGWDIFVGRKRVIQDIRGSLYDVRVMFAGDMLTVSI